MPKQLRDVEVISSYERAGMSDERFGLADGMVSVVVYIRRH